MSPPASRRLLSRLPHTSHLIGAALVLCGLLCIFLIPRTNGKGELRVVADFASNRLNLTFLSLGILLLLSLAYARRSVADLKRIAWVMGVVTVIVQAGHQIGFHVFGLWPRPSGGDGGFPSGHASAACALAYLLTERVPKLFPLWYAIAALIAWSRVEAGAHYPYQVVAGAILGFAVGFAFHARSTPQTPDGPSSLS